MVYISAGVRWLRWLQLQVMLLLKMAINKQILKTQFSHSQEQAKGQAINKQDSQGRDEITKTRETDGIKNQNHKHMQKELSGYFKMTECPESPWSKREERKREKRKEGRKKKNYNYCPSEHKYQCIFVV